MQKMLRAFNGLGILVLFDDNKPVTPQAWETVKKGGDVAIKKWILEQMNYRSCVIVLIGEKTWESKYVQYEIEYAWKNDKPLFGIYINEMKDINGNTAPKPFFTPFDLATDLNTNRKLNTFVEVHTPIVTRLQTADRNIQNNLEAWVEDAIANPPQNRMRQVVAKQQAMFRGFGFLR